MKCLIVFFINTKYFPDPVNDLRQEVVVNFVDIYGFCLPTLYKQTFFSQLHILMTFFVFLFDVAKLHRKLVCDCYAGYHLIQEIAHCIV